MIDVWTAQLGQLRRIATVETTLSLVFQVPDEMFGRKWSSVFREKKKLAQEDMIMLLLLLLRLSDWLILFDWLISGLFGSFHNLSSVSFLSIHRFIPLNWIVNCLIDRLVDWLIHQLFTDFYWLIFTNIVQSSHIFTISSFIFTLKSYKWGNLIMFR